MDRGTGAGPEGAPETRDPWVAAEESIGRLAEVLGVTVTRGGDDVEIQVLLRPTSAGPDLRARVRRILEATVGKRPGELRVLLFEADLSAEPAAGGEVALLDGRRPELREALVETRGDTAEVLVTIAVEETEYTSRRPVGREERDFAAVVGATLDALGKAIGDDAFGLDDVTAIEMRGERSVCVQLRRESGPARLLLGGARLGDESAWCDALARATLDAVNRQL